MTAPVMIFLDGKVVPADPLLLERLRPGRFRDYGVFETLRVMDGRVLFVREHLMRLRRGLAVLGLESPCPVRELPHIIDRLLACGQLRDARVRVSVWSKRAKVHVAVVAQAYSPPGERVYQEGWRGRTVVVRGVISRPAPYVKSLNYGIYARAWERARRECCDEVVLCRSSGEIIEGSRSNVFFVRRGEILTPPLATQCLQGVTRQMIVRIARAEGIRLRQTRFCREELPGVDEAFASNALVGIMRLGSIDGEKIGGRAPGPVITKLYAGYAALIQKQMM